MSQPRTRGKAKNIVMGDMTKWAKEHGDNLYKMLMWCWRLKSKTEKSYDPDLQDIKNSMGVERKRLRQPTSGSGSMTKQSQPSDVALKALLETKQAVQASLASCTQNYKISC